METTLNREQIAKLDSQQLLSSIEVLHKQIADAWSTTNSMEFPEEYKKAKKIVWFGMGGSQLGIDFIKSVYLDQLTVPVEIVNDYHIPAIVDEDTLVVLSSYSGTTEEVVTVSKEILSRTKMVMVITTGGDLEQFASDNSLPAYIFNPVHNPSNQPRMAVGYSVAGTMGAFAAMGYIKVTQKEIDGVVAHVDSMNAAFGADNEDNNTAKKLATQMNDVVPIMISSEFLQGAAHVMTNQINENGKQFAVRFPIPEMNHHLIEGLVFPADNKPLMVFLQSSLYHERNQVRHRVTEGVAKDNGLTTAMINMRGESRLQQAFELLLFGSYVSLYRAILNGTDPSPIPNVDLLKEELKKA